MNTALINILIVNKSEEDIEVFNTILQSIKKAQFNIIWKRSAENTIEYINQENEVDIIVLEENLTEMAGIELLQKLEELKRKIPIIFLLENNDINLAVEVMRLGAKDCFLKSDIYNKVFTQSIIQIVEKDRLKNEMYELELKQKRLEAMQEIILGISDKISKPLDEMNKILVSLEQCEVPDKAVKFLLLIKENIERMQNKLEKLRNLKDDKTVKYIRDIKMIDLS